MGDFDTKRSLWEKIKMIFVWTMVKISFRVFRYYIVMKEDQWFFSDIMVKGSVWRMKKAGSYRLLFDVGPKVVFENIDTKQQVDLYWADLKDDEYIDIEKSEIEAAKLLYG